MIKKDIRMEMEKGVVVYQGKGMYFWQCTSKWVALDIKRTAKTNTVVAKIKYNFWLPLFQMFQLLYIEESAMGHLKQGVLF